MKSKIELFSINKVREKRISHNISQSDLADFLNVSPGFIGKIESSKYSSHYNLNHLNELSKLFKCSPTDFLPKNPL